MPRPPTYDHLRSKKKPVSRTVWIVFDSEAAEHLSTLQNRRDAIVGRGGNAEALETEIREERDRLVAEGAVCAFRFQSIGRRAYDDLVTGNPPTEEQVERARDAGIDGDLGWNEETFPPAIVAASCVSPTLTPEDALEIWNSPDWNQAELAALFAAAIEVNASRRVVSDLGNVSGGTRRSEQKSRTASSTGSRTPASSDDQ